MKMSAVSDTESATKKINVEKNEKNTTPTSLNVVSKNEIFSIKIDSSNVGKRRVNAAKNVSAVSDTTATGAAH